MPRVEVWIYILIIALAVQAPAFFDGDPLIFHLTNNFHNTPLIYSLNGYFQVLPEIVAYAVSPLPFTVQIVLYRVFSIVILCILYVQLRELFALRFDRGHSIALAISAIMLIRFLDFNMISTLTFTNWTASIAAFAYVVRVNISYHSYTPVGVVAAIMGFASSPLQVLMLPLLLAYTRPIDSKVSRWMTWANLVIGIAVIAVLAVQYLTIWQYRSSRTLSFEGYVSAVTTAFHHDWKLQVVLILLSLIVLVAAGLFGGGQLLMRGWHAAEPRMLLILSYFGIGSIALYVASPRFAYNVLTRQAFPPRYSAALCLCALLAIVFGAIAAAKNAARASLVGATVGFTAALATVAIYPSVTGPLKSWLQTYAFLAEAGRIRESCNEAGRVIAQRLPGAQEPTLVYCVKERDPPSTAEVW